MGSDVIAGAEPALVIAGERVAAATTFAVHDPATGALVAEAPDASRAQLDDAFAAAAAAQPGWAADPGARRAALLGAVGALLGAVDRLAPLLTAEQGKPLAQARDEVQGAAWWIAQHAKIALEPEVIRDDDRAHVTVRRVPVGVVAAITPWNFPLLLAAWKLGPALSTGNAVVLKPSPYTPLSTLAMVELLAAHLPPGVLSAVSGGNDLGAWMTAHPVPRKVSFTGSIATGKAIAAAVADDLKHVTLELGGNDAAVVLDDADPAAVARGIVEASFLNAGQVCCAVKRVYVPASLEAALVDALADRVAALRVGPGTEEGVDVGPVSNAPQLERVAGLVGAALRDGAEAVVGGSRLAGGGLFHAPTLLRGARDGMAIVDEEQFGPALPVIAYRDEDAAIAAANGTRYGLDGSVWSADPERAEAVAARLECGTTWINTHLANHPYQPFGGTKWSGLGTENGRWGLESFTEVRVTHRAVA